MLHPPHPSASAARCARGPTVRNARFRRLAVRSWSTRSNPSLLPMPPRRGEHDSGPRLWTIAGGLPCAFRGNNPIGLFLYSPDAIRLLVANPAQIADHAIAAREPPHFTAKQSGLINESLTPCREYHHIWVSRFHCFARCSC